MYDDNLILFYLMFLLDLLTYFAAKELPFLMECCRRTEADKKGGHLAVRSADGQLILRESAQCAKEDESAFQNVDKHQFFNTNNLWVRLDFLKQLMDSKGGFVPLPTLLNGKTVDPQQVPPTSISFFSSSLYYFRLDLIFQLMQ